MTDELGFGRRPGDGAAAPTSLPQRWLGMEFYSDPIWKSAGVSPAKWSLDEGGVLIISAQFGPVWMSYDFGGETLHGIDLGNSLLFVRKGIGDRWLVRIWQGRSAPGISICCLFVWDPDWEVRRYILDAWSINWRYDGNTPFVLWLLGFCFQVSKDQLMAAMGGGSEKGIVSGTITHPKPPGDVGVVSSAAILRKSNALVVSEKVAEGSTKHDFLQEMMNSQAATGFNTDMAGTKSQGPAVFTKDVEGDKEEEAIEVNLEEDEVEKAGQWTILSCFYSLRIPNATALFEDMSRAWRLRADMNYKALRDNMFIITFGSEGDYNFVLQGGPWLRPNTRLVGAIPLKPQPLESQRSNKLVKV
uniref:OSJNBa0089K21.7 protein n=3 Tax=Oryza sativa TaxID=4530 RepID=Q7XQM9_ORYSJ|nr:OSJNBa0089K21.7 [Oryza sativa Japonica Group]CAH67048.1 OSIGBa0124N08.10 [Oryza sativa]CAH67210.1 H0418A01.3 [Oryza sativa]